MRSRLDLPPPVTDVFVDDGGGSEWVHLIKARHDIDAHLLEGRLQEVGIESRKVKDRGAPGAWIYAGSNPWAPVSILVRRLQLEDARLVLAEISFDGPPAVEGTPAPAPRGVPFPVLWWVTALVLGVVFVVLTLGQIARANMICQLPSLCEESGTP